MDMSIIVIVVSSKALIKNANLIRKITFVINVANVVGIMQEGIHWLDIKNRVEINYNYIWTIFI